MSSRRLLLAGVAAGVLGVALRRASLGGIRDPRAVQRLYDRLAPAYDVAAWPLQVHGSRRLRTRAIQLLNLQPGDTVVDLGCGTGINFAALAEAVGPTGRIVGVDLSAGMLARARQRADRAGLDQVTVTQADMREVRLPEGTAAVLATASLEMVPEHEAVVRSLADQLTPTHGRLAVGGFRRPPTWPAWAVALGRAATAVFGVNRAYEEIQPWRSVRRHLDEIAFETAMGGALYLIVGQARPLADAAGGDHDRGRA